MAQTSGPRRTLVDRFRLFPLPEELDPMWLENFNREWELYKTDPQQSRFTRRASIIYGESNSPTKTPENQKLSPILPNAPFKLHKMIRKPDLRPRKLDYTEPEDDPRNPADFSMGSGSNNMERSSRTDEIQGRTKNPEIKRRQNCQNKSRKKLPNCDKENDGSLADRLRTAKTKSSTTRETNIVKNRSKLSSTKKLSRLESDFAHFRI